MKYPKTIMVSPISFGLTLRLDQIDVTQFRLISTDVNGKGHMWLLSDTQVLNSLFNQMHSDRGHAIQLAKG